jgi:hypothetical protein
MRRKLPVFDIICTASAGSTVDVDALSFWKPNTPSPEWQQDAMV